MKTYARIEAGVVREVIVRANAFDLTTAYHSSLISDGLGGTAGAEEGFVLAPDAATVNERDLFSGGVFAPPPPPPPRPSDADIVDQHLQGDLLWKAWVSRQAKIEGKTPRQIIDELRTALP